MITLLLAALAAAAGFAAWQVYVPVAPAGQQFVMLRPGYSSRHIAAELKKAGIIRSELAFRLWHATHPKPSLKAGEYLFEREATLPQVYGRIARGDIYFHTVTIPEGYTMFDIAKAMEDAGLCPAADFLHLAETQTQLISDIAPVAKSLEGYLFPNTYQFTRTQSLEEMAGAMVHQFRFHVNNYVCEALTSQDARSTTALQTGGRCISSKPPAPRFRFLRPRRRCHWKGGALAPIRTRHARPPYKQERSVSTDAAPFQYHQIMQRRGQPQPGILPAMPPTPLVNFKP